MKNTRPTTLEDYQQRMQKVLVYLQQHYHETVSLEEVAAVASFSPYHFHRIFKGMVGESLQEYCRRLRLERAAQRLKIETVSITTLAFDSGYETVESFSRAFKRRFDISPQNFRQYKKTNPSSPCSFTTFNLGDTMNAEIKELAPCTVAYVRHTGPYNECASAWEKLCTWAGPQGLLQPGVQFIGVCYDDPDITPADKIRYDACLQVTTPVKPAGEIAVQELPGGTYAWTTHQGPYEKLSDTYAQLCGQWIPQQGHTPSPQPSIEIYLNSPEDTPAEELLTDIYIPIERD